MPCSSPVIDGDGLAEEEYACGGDRSTCAHSGVVGVLPSGGAVALPDPRMPTEPPGRGGQGVCYRAGLLLLNHFPYLQPVITFYLRKIA